MRQARWKLFLFGLFKIPVIGYCRPKLVALSRDEVNIRIGLRRKTRNHVGSMYLGVMTVGADLASGFLAFHILEQRGLRANPVFKGMRAEYYKRAESDVDFVCEHGRDIVDMIDEMERTGERVTKAIEVKAMCKGEEVAKFFMDLSLKAIKK